MQTRDRSVIRKFRPPEISGAHAKNSKPTPFFGTENIFGTGSTSEDARSEVGGGKGGHGQVVPFAPCSDAND